jgi:hypothetical protein
VGKKTRSSAPTPARVRREVERRLVGGLRQALERAGDDYTAEEKRFLLDEFTEEIRRDFRSSTASEDDE